MTALSKISPNLWFDTQAEEAAKYYTSIFKNSSIGRITKYGKEGTEIHHKPAGAVMCVEFTIEGQTFLALNGGPDFKFSEAISFIIDCKNQEEVDYYWNKLGEGGDPAAQVCGWLKDKFGVSWQVVPSILNERIADPDQAKADRVMKAMLGMKKLIIEEIEEAYHGQNITWKA